MASVITNLFKNFVCTLLGGTGGTAFPAVSPGTVSYYLAWGFGSGRAPQVTDTSVDGELGPGRTLVVPTLATTNVASDTAVFNGDITAGVTTTIDNVGLLDAATAGHLFLHVSFPAYTVPAASTVTFILNLTAS